MENWRDGERSSQGSSRGRGFGNRPRRQFEDNQENGGGGGGGGGGYGNRGPRRQYDDNQEGGGGGRGPRRQYDDNQEGGGGRGYGGGRPRRQYDDQDGEGKVIMVPAHKVGKIIGRGGSKIQELQSESGARIKVGNANGNETDVTLRGSEEAIALAESLINELVVSEYTGGQGGGRNDYSASGGDQYNRQS